MRKTIWILLLFAILPITALASEFGLDESAVLPGMNDRSWAQGYAPTEKNDTLTIYLPLSAGEAQGEITATLIPADETVSPFRPQALSASFGQTDGMYEVAFSLKLRKDRRNGDYPAIVRAEGVDGDGNALSVDIPIVIRIRSGLMNDDSPKPVIEDVAADLRPGEYTVVTALLRNESRSAEMTDFALVLTDDSGEILPGDSNTLRLPNLLPGERCEIVYPVCVLPGAALSPHGLRFELQYSYLGQNGLWRETFTLPVTQDMRLERGALELAETVIQGDSVTATLPLMNMGRGDLRNVMVTLSLPGIVEKQSVLVGALASGETKYAKATVTPGTGVLGAVQGEMRVMYEDMWGNAGNFSLPVSLTVEAPAVKISAAADAESEETPETPWLLYGLSGGCILMLLLIIIQGAVYRRKIHRLEEEKL